VIPSGDLNSWLRENKKATGVSVSLYVNLIDLSGNVLLQIVKHQF